MDGYPVERNLDGVYFRVKRGDKFKALCWSDLTDEERDEMGRDRPLEWWKTMAGIMTERLRYIGDQLHIECYEEEE